MEPLKQDLRTHEARGIIEKICPVYDGNHTYQPNFPMGRIDMCVVKHTVDNGGHTRYDVLYLVWKGVDEQVRYEEMVNTKESGEFIHLLSTRLVENDFVDVVFGMSVTFEGRRREESRRISLRGETPEILKPVPASV